MRKGLTLTLMTVAVAMLSFQAMAMAPVIGNIPSPIVGSAGATTSNKFVYPDAINLSGYVTDDNTAAADVKWSYWIATDGTHPQRYSFNGVPMLNLATDDPKVPGAKQINNQVLNSEQNPDTNAATITVRNVRLSPIGGPEVDPGATTGILSGETQMVTLFASDGTTYSQKELLLYTDNGGADRLSPGGTVVTQRTFVSSTSSYTWGGGSGNMTSGVTTQGLCFTVAAAGDNFGQWTGVMGDITPEANSVYKIRITVTGSNTDWNLVPFWDFYVENYDSATDTGANLYGQDCLFLGNTGGANAVLNAPRSYDMWFAPTAFNTPQWSGFGSLTAAQQRGRVNFRVMDFASRSDLGLQVDQGTVCFRDLTITRFPYSAMQVVDANTYNPTLSMANTSGTGTVNYGDDYAGSTASAASGVVTIAVNASGQNNLYGHLFPATFSQWDSTHMADKYPIPWVSNTLYQITAEIAATDANSQTNPFDVIWLGVDMPGNEAIMQALVTNRGNLCASPKTTASTYTAFWWSHNQSSSSVPSDVFFRPRLDLGNNTSLTIGNNSGGIKISKFQVKKVRFE